MTYHKRSPLDEIAPYPRNTAEATADRMIAHYIAFGLMHSTLALDMSDDAQSRKSVGHVVSSFALVFLLRQLRMARPDIADEAARDLWEHLEGGELSEWLYEWAVASEVDPKRVEQAAAVVAENIRAKQASNQTPTP